MLEARRSIAQDRLDAEAQWRRDVHAKLVNTVPIRVLAFGHTVITLSEFLTLSGTAYPEPAEAMADAWNDFCFRLNPSMFRDAIEQRRIP